MITIIKINKSERKYVEQACAETKTVVSFHPIPDDENILTAVFEEWDPGIMYHIGAMKALLSLQDTFTTSRL
jgi:hypothetical protein